MNEVINKSLAAKLLALSALALMACPTTPGNDGGTGGGGGGEECAEAADCVALKGGTQAEWYCNASTALCEAACRTNDNCNPGTRQSEALAQCAGALGCVCDEGRCIGSQCSDDSQCSTDGTSVCRSGACVTPPAASTVTSCEIVPNFAVLAAGAKQTFHVSAWAGTDPVSITAGATWTANGGGTVPATNTGNKIEFTAGSANFAAGDAVTATFGTITCKAQAVVIAAPGAGNTVVAIDELSGRPISGATVAVTDATGALVGTIATTGANGGADVTLAANQVVTLLHKDYSYLSIVNAAPATKLIAAVVRRNQVDKFGGFKGGITNLPADNTIKAAIAGMSVAGNITNLNITQLLGPSVSTDIALSDTIKVDDVPLPSGIFLYFNKVLTGRGTPPDGKVVGMGLAGTCGDATKEAAGTCGTRSAWALTGSVELTKIVSLASAVTGGFDLSKIGDLLGSVVPLLKNFKSSLVRDVKFSLIDTPWNTDGSANFDDVSGTNFTAQDIEFGQLPLGFAFPVKMPALPQFGGQYIDAVAVLGGANAPGRGVVPLGLGVGVNTKEPKDSEVDAIGTDGDDGYVAAGRVGVRMAPNHHGTEGSDYGLLVLGISASALTDPAAGIGISAIFPRLSKLEFKTEVNISGNAFPGFPESATFDYSPTQTAGRTFAMTTVANTGVIRVSFSGEKERRWDVLVANGATVGFHLPKLADIFGGAANVPADLTDRLYTNPSAAPTALQRASMTVQAFRLTSDGTGAGTAATFDNYVDLSTGYQADTTHHLTAFSLQAFSPPSLSLSFASATALTVEAKGASIATGKNKVQLTLPSGCTSVPDGATAQSETEAGKNTVTYALSGCSAKEISAALVNNAGAAFDPPVTATGTAP